MKISLVLDSNEYIDDLNGKTRFVQKLATSSNCRIYAHEMIIREVLRNIEQKQRRVFYQMLMLSNFVLYQGLLPIALVKKYKSIGLKKGDIVIAALCDQLGVDCLISENRHFLKEQKLSFKAISRVEFRENFNL